MVETAQKHFFLITVQRRASGKDLQRLTIQSRFQLTGQRATPTQGVEQHRPTAYVLGSQQIIAPQVQMTGARQPLRLRCFFEFAVQGFMATVIDQPLPVAFGPGQRVGRPEKQGECHWRRRIEGGETMPGGQCQSLALVTEQQPIVVGIGHQPMQAESVMFDTPERQTQILSGIEFPLIQQKGLPHRIATRHVVPLGQRPDQRLAHRADGLMEKFQFCRLTRRDREGQITLIERGAEGPGPVIPLPVDAVVASAQLTDFVRGNPRRRLHRLAAGRGDPDSQRCRIELYAPQRVFQWRVGP